MERLECVSGMGEYIFPFDRARQVQIDVHTPDDGESICQIRCVIEEVVLILRCYAVKSLKKDFFTWNIRMGRRL